MPMLCNVKELIREYVLLVTSLLCKEMRKEGIFWMILCLQLKSGMIAVYIRDLLEYKLVAAHLHCHTNLFSCTILKL